MTNPTTSKNQVQPNYRRYIGSLGLILKESTDAVLSAAASIVASASGDIEIAPKATKNTIFQDGSDNTKGLVLNLSGITTGNNRGLAMADANVDLADIATQDGLISDLSDEVDFIIAEIVDMQLLIPILQGVADGGTFTPAVTSGGLETLTRTAAAPTESAWIPVPAPNRAAASLGVKPTGLLVNYSVDTADADDVRFELWKITQGADGAARTAAVLFGEDDADYDADHNTAAERGDDTGAPELHHTTITDAGAPAYMGTGETLILRAYVDGDAGGASAVVVTSAILVYSETQLKKTA